MKETKNLLARQISSCRSKINNKKIKPNFKVKLYKQMKEKDRLVELQRDINNEEN